MKIISRWLFIFLLLVEPSTSDNAFKAALLSQKDLNKDALNFYEKMSFEPVWFFQGQLTKCGQIALDVLQNASLEGLNPHDYEDVIQILASPLRNWVEAEVLLTTRFLEFITHVRVGRIDPTLISHNIKFHTPKTHPVELLVDAVQNKMDCHKLRLMAPTFSQYEQLKEVLAHYRKIAADMKNWPKLNISKPLKLGDKGPNVLTVRQILTFLGDLKTNQSSSSKFDKNLEESLRKFQKRNTIDPNGVVAEKTKDALMRTIDDLIHKVLVNMERLRWLPENLGDRYIIVNVAGYKVEAYRRGERDLTIPAIVGRPRRQTPLFYAAVKNVVINPSWGVPHSILVHDKLPKIMNDPDYIRRSGFTVTDSSGNVIDPDHADWENEGASYHLRQSPGSHNALGRVKINIENPYTIYLHGTPEAKLFNKMARAFSSGCVRLKYPTELAAWVLDDAEKWDKERIEEAIHKGTTKSVSPNGNIAVFFTYQTVWVEDDGLVHISDDPYKLDPKMEKALRNE